jgi:ATP/maltotriose-dependent transcriptional regulator MalT
MRFAARAAPLSSPVLVGRDDLLELADRRLAEARSGRGLLLLLAGEAGIGKTRLLGAIERRASLAGMVVIEAAAFPRDLEVAGGLLLDLARALDAGDSRNSETARRLRERLGDADAERRGDAHRHRRLLVTDLVDVLAELPARWPVLLTLEDLHWADDLALEVLAHLARAVGGLKLLVAGTYRSDELYPRTPMREWRSRLVTQRLAEEVRLTRLDLNQTGMLARALLGDPTAVSHELVADLHRRSDGIPLHVEELLGASLAQAEGSASLVPDTLSDAILGRADRLSARARRLAEVAAIIGRSFDVHLLAAVAQRPETEIDRALGELRDRFFVAPGRRDGWYDFRHALIRDALYATVGPRARRRLHGRVAALLTERGAEDAAVASHYELAGLDADAHRTSLRAAERASRLSSHREAAELYRRAVRTLPSHAPAGERAQVLAAYGFEAAAGDDNAAAAEAYAEARHLLLDAGDPSGAAALVPALVAVRHLLGASLDERVALVRTGLEEVASVPGREDRDAMRARLLAALSAAYMLDRRLDDSIEHGDAARTLAQRLGDREAELNASVTLGSDLVFAGRMDEGWPLLEGAIAEARDQGHEAEAARAYRMIGSSASVLVEYDRAERWLREGIEYAERVELWNHRHYMAAHLAHVAWATGDWHGAEALANEALADGRGGITTRITALHVLGYLAMGRGEAVRAEEWLGEARDAGERMGELQRLSPAIWGLAETALLAGRLDDAAALCEAGHQASAAVQDAAYLYPYLVTGTRALLDAGRIADAERWVAEIGAQLRHRSIPGTLPAISHAEGLLLLARGSTGAARRRLSAAHDGWASGRRVWEQAWALLDGARAESRAHRRRPAAAHARLALEQALALGATPLAERAETLARDLRVDRDRDEPWTPLTAREYEVATLVADGRTNSEIAAELGIAPKTVSSHVEHILDRLGVGRRAEIAAWVAGRARDAPS